MVDCHVWCRKSKKVNFSDDGLTVVWCKNQLSIFPIRRKISQNHAHKGLQSECKNSFHFIILCLITSINSTLRIRNTNSYEEYIKEFRLDSNHRGIASRSSMHGISFIFDRDISIVDRLLWLFLVIAFAGVAAALTWNLWISISSRYNGEMSGWWHLCTNAKNDYNMYGLFLMK